MSPDVRDETVRLTDAEARARRRRSLAIGLVLAVLVVLFYVVSLFRIAGGGA
ncbi:protoheme IX farnesyltransferase [Aureimonas flava]|uniref:Protoheme IX farnesyltransferase n=1 Tax=Aureimonas flava TaxID=2320271 RepID=A0A3A1WQR0_9HYPH|nr:protoheme IX farnesyltransferase [Aureimonas flava]RIY03394.1 protoheme IX farnesyltransferase [Aureimonas flava]